jgi:phage FluMu gp28-like protein
MWNTQYDLQDPNPEGRAIYPEKVERMFVGASVLSEVGDGEFPYREFELPVEGATYATGGDWARTRDYVEITTLRTDVTPLRLVAYERFRKKATQYTLAQVEGRVARYPGTLTHDATSLGGQMMDDLIEVGEDTAVAGVEMVGRRRRDLFTDYILAIEHEEIVSPRIDVLYNQHKFVKNDDLWGAGHPPDGFVAGALAYRGSGAAGTTRPLRLLGGASSQASPDATGLDRMLRFLGGGNGHGNGGG